MALRARIRVKAAPRISKRLASARAYITNGLRNGSLGGALAAGFDPSSALEASCGAPGRLDIPAVEVPEFDAVRELHAVSLPVEPICKDHLAFGADRHAGELNGRTDPVSHAKFQLVRVRLGEGMRLPDGHT